MSEIKRPPIIYESIGYTIFDEDHTFADIIRYLLSAGCSAEEIAILVACEVGAGDRAASHGETK